MLKNQTLSPQTSTIPNLYDICLDEYGIGIIIKDQIVRSKTLEMCFEKYGHKDLFINPSIQSWMQENSIIKHAIDKLLQYPDVRSQIIKSCEHLFPNAKPVKQQKPKEIPQYDEDSLKQLSQNYENTKQEIRGWLNEGLGFNFEYNYQLSKTNILNLYDPDIHVAIDYCGIYDSALTTREQYNKFKSCLMQGIQLITIFSDEWETKQKQCMGHIKSVLGLKQDRVFARKCEIKTLFKNEACNFFDEYHIQGKNNLALVCYGLFYKGDLVAAMTFGRHHRQNTDQSDAILDRLCFKDGIQVIGGASKLLKACREWAKQEGFNKIISFSDNRWSIGKVYEAMNFICDREYRPDYSYVDLKNPTKRISKQSQRKGSTNCPAGMTELEWATARNLVRIWDCGKKRWIINL